MMPRIVFSASLLLYLFLPILGFITGGFSSALSFTLLGVSLLTNVVLHEVGHCFFAKRYGDKHCYITIGATGGSTSYSGAFMSNRQLTRVIMAGPSMNILIGVVATLIWGLSSLPAQVSFYVAFFNLLPIKKLDGGQLLCLFLDRRLDYHVEKLVALISALTGMLLVAYLYFNFPALIALAGIYWVGYLYTTNGT